MSYYYLTKHVVERMTERKITKRLLDKCLAEGEKIRNGRSGAVHHSLLLSGNGLDITAALIAVTDGDKVVTTYIRIFDGGHS